LPFCAGGAGAGRAIETPSSTLRLKRHPLALRLMVASGFAALGYQIVWTQQCALWLGHESAAVLAVVAAFFGGLAVGALALGTRIQRSGHPARWYAACELAIAGWSLLLAWGMAPASDWLLQLTGAQPSALWQWAVAFSGSFLLLLPATAAMGATMPAMEQVLSRLQRGGTCIGALYAGNTLGAVLGVLATAFWLVPTFGLARTAGLCAALNLACAAAALALLAPDGEAAESGPPRSAPDAVGARRMLGALAATGLLGIGYEVLAVRVLSQVAQNTVYTFAMLLAVYLVGTACGAAAYQRWMVRLPDATALRDRLLCLLAAACLVGGAGLWGAPSVLAAVQRLAGNGMGAALAAEAALALLAFLPPTLLMGALFSHLSTQARRAGISFGRAMGVNTLAAATAPLLVGVLLLPAAGAKLSLLLLVVAYLALSSRRSLRGAGVWAALGAVAALAWWAPPLAFVDVPEDGKVLYYEEGAMAAVSVVQDSQGVARLRIDNRQQEGSNSSLLADARQAWLPLLLHPAPQRALFLGLGTGVTARSAAEDPTLQVDAVELLPEVLAASAHFAEPFAGGAHNPRLHLLAADARRFVRAGGQLYDVIVSDNFHPARSGSGSLYTVEHFQAVKARLVPGGLFCQWLPLHQLDLDTLRSIVRSFLQVHPGAWAMLATNSLETPVLGLLARENSARFELLQLKQRLGGAALARSPAQFGITDPLALLGNFVAGPQALARFAGNAPRNTDDHPVVAYSAPRITYAPDSLPRERLAQLMASLQVEPAEVLSPSTEAGWMPRLAAYWAARNAFLEAGRDIRPSADVHRMLEQVQEPLLEVLSRSPDFRPAYDPLLRMAIALGRTDAAAARTLLMRLVQTQPNRPEAAQALMEMQAASP
jgi:spermidine synthase